MVRVSDQCLVLLGSALAAAWRSRGRQFFRRPLNAVIVSDYLATQRMICGPGPRRLTVTDTWDPEIPTFHFKGRNLIVIFLSPRCCRATREPTVSNQFNLELNANLPKDTRGHAVTSQAFLTQSRIPELRIRPTSGALGDDHSWEIGTGFRCSSPSSI